MQTEFAPESRAQPIVLEGRFDAHEVVKVRERFTDAMNGGAESIIVDLERVVFIDSKALALLVRFMKRCREAGGDLRLANVSQPVRIILELTKLDRAFVIEPAVGSMPLSA
jgi:anti-sigma B factor antagonist